MSGNMVIIDFIIDLSHVYANIIALVICTTYEWLNHTMSGSNMLISPSATCDDKLYYNG